MIRFINFETFGSNEKTVVQAVQVQECESVKKEELRFKLTPYPGTKGCYYLAYNRSNGTPIKKLVRDVNPTDWIVRTSENSIFIIDDAHFRKLYMPTIPDLPDVFYSKDILSESGTTTLEDIGILV